MKAFWRGFCSIFNLWPERTAQPYKYQPVYAGLEADREALHGDWERAMCDIDRSVQEAVARGVRLKASNRPRRPRPHA